MSAQTNMPNFGRIKGEEDNACNNQVDDFGCDEDEVASEHSTGPTANERCLQINPSLGLINLAASNNTGCSIHQKAYQAFCEEDFRMCCLDCIIEENSTHRGHKMMSMAQARAKFKIDLEK